MYAWKQDLNRLRKILPRNDRVESVCAFGLKGEGKEDYMDVGESKARIGLQDS